MSLEWHPSHHIPSISSILWSTNEAFPPIFSPQDHSRINYDVIELLLEYIEARWVGHQWEITYRRCTWYQGSEQFAHVQRDQGAILVFLQLSSNRGYVKSYQGHVETKPRPGMMEITKMHERLRGNPLFSDPSSCREPKSNVWFGVFFVSLGKASLARKSPLISGKFSLVNYGLRMLLLSGPQRRMWTHCFLLIGTDESFSGVCVQEGFIISCTSIMITCWYTLHYMKLVEISVPLIQQHLTWK